MLGAHSQPPGPNFWLPCCLMLLSAFKISFSVFAVLPITFPKHTFSSDSSLLPVRPLSPPPKPTQFEFQIKCKWPLKNTNQIRIQAVNQWGNTPLVSEKDRRRDTHTVSHTVSVWTTAVWGEDVRLSRADEGLSNESNAGELELTEFVSTNQRQTGEGRCKGSSLTLPFFLFSFCFGEDEAMLSNDDDDKAIHQTYYNHQTQSHTLHQECLTL